MTIVWSRAALLDIDEIGDFLAAIDPVVERRTLARIQARATALAIYSGLGRPGRVLGTRELVVSGKFFVLAFLRPRLSRMPGPCRDRQRPARRPALARNILSDPT